MKKCLVLCMLLMISQTSLMANDIYSALGISIQKKKLSSTIVIKKVKLFNECEVKKNYKNSFIKFLKYLKSKKISQEARQYGFGIDYKVSKKVQLIVNVLTQLDINEPSNMIGDREANIKLAISL